MPEASFKAENDFGEVIAKRNFILGSGKSSLLAGLNLGYNENLKGDYQYSGAYSDSETVTEMYKNDIMFLSSDYLTVGGEVTPGSVPFGLFGA